MNSEYTRLAIHRQISLIHIAISRTVELASNVPLSTPEECPMRTGSQDNHHKNSQMLFGIGEKKWTCLFCGTTEHI